jgi:hypothetical protein
VADRTAEVLAEIARRERALLAVAMTKLADGVNGQRCDSHVRVAEPSSLTVVASPRARRASHNPYDPR